MSKRTLDDFDPTKSDPEDEDYTNKGHRRPRVPGRPKTKSKPRRKRQRTSYGDDASEDISDSMLEDDSLSDATSLDGDSEDQEINEATGRPVRRSTKKPIVYDEDSDEGSIDYMNRMDEVSNKKTTDREGKQQKLGQHSKSLIVKLALPPSSNQAVTSRNRNARSDGASLRKETVVRPPIGLTRRSSRLAHDDTQPLVALTNSGNHEDVVRPGTRSPEAISPRPARIRQALKKLPSAILEDDEIMQGPRHSNQDAPLDRQAAEQAVEQAILTEEDDDLPRTQEYRSDIEVSATQIDPDDKDTNPDLVVPESNVEDDDDDDEIVRRPRRETRRQSDPGDGDDEGPMTSILSTGARARRSRRTRLGLAHKKGLDDTSDFEPEQAKASDDEVSVTSEDKVSPRKVSAERDDSSNGPRQAKRRRRTVGVGSSASDANDSEVAEEIAVELQELKDGRPERRKRRDSFEGKPRTRTRKPVDYRILRPETNLLLEDEGPPVTSTPSKRRGGATGGWQRSLFSTYGPFGGAGGPAPVFGGPPGATGGVDSDSSDDDGLVRPRAGAIPALAAATPTAAAPPGFGMFPAPHTHSSDPLQSTLGKVKDKQALADADPLGVDQNVTFDGVGGMQGHIDQLKEMVMLPLLYPEIFQKFRITPPRGVLFHGPPGTGKTLLARALASTVSSQGRKVTFYMRKGADALSKWVGEAERQLRLLFEEARKNQPSIIFFDEIDGLAPVRSSKQEQIHASIVSTLLALMDGMDGRGQVIVIGATNRPDSVDPALRRPGRFDREFYFPLPDQDARRAIIDIHTKGWVPPVSTELKDQLAVTTKGYGGADLRALCTEAALNSVQRTYPQIYKSYEKRLINTEKIKVTSRDFILSLEKIVPSSERSATSGSAPLPKDVVPLLGSHLSSVRALLDDMMPRKKKRTALDEAEYEDSTKESDLKHELLHQDFLQARVFRPRLLLQGPLGMGQAYLAAAVLSYFEGTHVQNFDLSILLGDATRSPEATIVQLFTEVRRHKPSVIYIPNVSDWYGVLSDVAITTFLGLLQSLPPSEPILVFGFANEMLDRDQPRHMELISRLFGYASRNRYTIDKPTKEHRRNFFSPLLRHLRASPSDFPDPESRRRRIIEELPLAPESKVKGSKEPTKEEMKIQQKRDRRTLNHLKLRIQPIMDQIKMKYKKFRTPVIEDSLIRYLFDEEDSATLVMTDLPLQARQQSQFRPFERGKDGKGEPGLLETATGRFYYNMETVTIEKRLSNGYYKRPRDFLADIKKLTKDAKTAEDTERLLKANELQTNVEVDLDQFEIECPALVAECEALFQRETKRQQPPGHSERHPSQPMAPPEAPGRGRDQLDDVEMADTQGNTDSSISRRHDMMKADNSFYQASQQSFTSNGIIDLDRLPGQQVSNSTSNTSNGFKTTPSSDSQSTERVTQSNSFGQSAQTRSIYHSTGIPITVEQRFQTGQLSQRGAITPIAEGANPSMYHNSASTTSSDKQNTTSSGERTTQSTQPGPDTQDIDHRLDVSNLAGQPVSGSQLPDTQSSQQDTTSSSPSTDRLRLIGSTTDGPDQSQSAPSQPSQAPTIPRYHDEDPMQISKLVNGGLGKSKTGLLQVDEVQIRAFGNDLVEATSSCTVEQLQQVNSVLMDHIWRSRGDWNRKSVVRKADQLLRDALSDMHLYQHFGKSSMENGY